MWGVIAVLVVVLVGFYLVVIRGKPGWNTSGVKAADGVLAAVFAVVIVGSILLGGVDAIPTARELVVTDTPLVALKDNSSLTGRVFLFGGSSEGKPGYYYYRAEGDGLVLEHIAAVGVVVYEDTVDTAYLRTQWDRATAAHKAAWLHWYVFADGKQAAPDELHVPPGTIRHEFVLDAE